MLWNEPNNLSHWDRPGAEEWFDYVLDRLADFDLTLTLCFTPARAGRAPHHTSPPVHLGDFADFCAAVLTRYRRFLPAVDAPLAATSTLL